MTSPRQPPLAVLLLAGLTATAALALGRTTRLRDAWPPEADQLDLPAASTLRFASLGHTDLAADLVAARSNVYYGTQMATKGKQHWLERYLTTAADLDPLFHRLYLSGASMLVYNGQPFTVQAIEAANGLLERGIQFFPGDWELQFQLGFNNFFELPRLTGENDARAAKWRDSGIEALRQAALLDDIPPWLPSLVARLLTKRGSQDLAIKHLEQAYATASSEETREQIKRKLISLQAQHLSDQIEEDRRRFEESLKQGYPYAPESFNVVVGPRRRFATSPPLP